MERKSIFTRTEVEQIRILIVAKLNATPYEQKVIRAKIRKIGFHFSDFSLKKNGYTVADFEELIRVGEINVNDDNLKSPILISNPVQKPVPIKIKHDFLVQNNKDSFEPLVNNSTEVLILGTMPGDRSISVGEYYAHSGNRFWKIIARITNENIPISYDEKINLLINHKIGLWDVAKSANRKGSLDSNMSYEIPNDLDEFLIRHPKIRIIGFNGSKTVNLFKKFFSQHSHIFYHNLSSTSGANTSITFEESCNDWKRILS